jgi:hypothetical protein
MTLHNFNRLNVDNQLKLLWKNGFVTAERKSKNYSFILYSLFTFYVELRYYHTLLHGFLIGKDKEDFKLYKYCSKHLPVA